MTAVNIPQYLRPRVQSRQFIRNGFYPSAGMQTWLAEETNRILRWRTKSVEFSTPIAAIPTPTAGGASRTRWRFVIHASSHARYLWVKFELARTGQDAAGASTGDDPYGKLLVELSNGTDVGAAEFHGSRTDEEPTDAPSEYSTGYAILTSGGAPVVLTPNTDYFGTFSDEGGARIITACVYEETLPEDTDNGYLQSGVVSGGPITDKERFDMIPALRTAWKRNAAGLWVWASHQDSAAVTRVSGTSANWIDQSHTSVSSSSPGITHDLTASCTKRRSTVPLKLWVHAKMSNGTGTVKLVGDTDGTLATVSVNSSTAAWYSATVAASPISQKFDLQVAGNGIATLTFYASSLLQFES